MKFSLPVVSVGNISTGGTGKTPHVEYLLDLLGFQYRCATMSRGYKRRSRGFLIANERATPEMYGDEPFQYFLKYPHVHVSVAEERVIGIPELVQQRPETQVIILGE